MGYRKSRSRVEAANEWANFLAANSQVIEAAGLPPEVTGSVESWDDFLRRGVQAEAGDATGFTVAQLDGSKYAALLQFVDSYFSYGYEYFTPAVLQADDLHRLEMRYRTA